MLCWYGGKKSGEAPEGLDWPIKGQGKSVFRLVRWFELFLSRPLLPPSGPRLKFEGGGASCLYIRDTTRPTTPRPRLVTALSPQKPSEAMTKVMEVEFGVPLLQPCILAFSRRVCCGGNGGMRAGCWSRRSGTRCAGICIRRRGAAKRLKGTDDPADQWELSEPHQEEPLERSWIRSWGWR